MGLKERFYPESRFGGFTDTDGAITFYARVNALLSPDDTVLDVGCGRGRAAEDKVPFRRNLRVLRGKCRRVVGIDLDEEAGASNPCLDEFRPITKPTWPVADGEVDLCLVDNVLEHVPDPAAFFAECARVIRPGGHLCIRTPNRRSYFGLAAWLIPERLHGRILRRAQPRRADKDKFPTLYRCNTTGRIRRMLRRHGFDGCVYGYEAPPSYLAFSRLTYALGVLHQRLAPRALRLTLFTFARRLEQPPGGQT
mgnify:FL=1